MIRTRSLLVMYFLLPVFLLSAVSARGTIVSEDPGGFVREFTLQLELPSPEWEPWEVEITEPSVSIPGLEAVALTLQHRISGDFEPPRREQRSRPVPSRTILEAASCLLAAGFAAFKWRKRNRARHTDPK